MTALVLILSSFIVGASIGASNGDIAPVCKANSSPYYGPKLPTLPTAFEAIIQANILNRNYSILTFESYDSNSNRGSVRMEVDGKKRRVIYNYNYNEMINVDEISQNCTVQDISSLHSFSIFGKNSSKIGSVAELFHFGAQFNETFKGETTVRGIKCYHWQSCVNHHNMSYVLDFYFSIPGWKMPNGNSTTMQAVRATIEGVSYNHHRGHGSTPGNPTHNFSHVYEFFSIIPGTPKEKHFLVPTGVFCAKMKDRKPLPTFTSVFSAELEMLDVKNKTSSYFKEVYDIQRKLVMFHYNDPRHGSIPIRSIHDFNTGLAYRISESKCLNVTLMTANKTWEATTTQDHHHLRMKTTMEEFYSGNLSEAIYAGSGIERGIDTEKWVILKKSRYNGKPVEMEFFLSQPLWNMRAGRLLQQRQVPIRLNMYSHSKDGRTQLYVINYAKFDAEPVPLHYFSIAACFAGKSRYLSIGLKVNWQKYVSGQERDFNSGVAKSIAKAANVSSIRVDRVRSYQVLNQVWIYFTLLDKPAASMFPPGYEPLVPENDLNQAVMALKRLTESGNLVLQWKDPVKGKVNSFRAEKWLGGISYPTRKPYPPSGGPSGPPVKPSHSKGVPPGAVAGVAFVMLAVGVCGGLAIAHVVMKRRGTSLFNYQRQE